MLGRFPDFINFKDNIKTRETGQTAGFCFYKRFISRQQKEVGAMEEIFRVFASEEEHHFSTKIKIVRKVVTGVVCGVEVVEYVEIGKEEAELTCGKKVA